MSYRVLLTHEAQQQLLDSACWWSEHRSTEQALRWLDNFEAAIRALADNANRQPLAHESDRLDYPLFNLLYGVGQRRTHRAVFRIRGTVVEVLAIRHLAQRDLTSNDI